MLFPRTLLAGIGLTLAAASAQAQSLATPTAPVREYPQSSIGLTLGWGAPYGWSVDYSHMLKPNLDVNVGVGIGVGLKIGVGTRYYFAPQRKVSPFVGANLVHTSGISDFNLTVNENQLNEDRTRLSIRATNLVHLRGGIRWQPTYRFALLGALGYGIRLGGDPVSYAPGYAPYYQSTRDVIDAIAPGGVEFSVGVAFGLGSRAN